MKRFIDLFAAIAFFASCSLTHAMYSVAFEGRWPNTWPKELEPLRKQSLSFCFTQSRKVHEGLQVKLAALRVLCGLRVKLMHPALTVLRANHAQRCYSPLRFVPDGA